jgi:hypothetical protein
VWCEFRYVDRNQSKNLMDFVRFSHVSLFVEISPFVYENKGQVSPLFIL